MNDYLGRPDRGLAPLAAAAWGVRMHAHAGHALTRRLGPLGFLAREISAEVPALIASAERTSSRSRSAV